MPIVVINMISDEHFHGQGKYKGVNGQFEGEYVDGSRNGFGKFQMANGDVYEGEFKGMTS
jgi:hypothetical protein